MLYCYVWECMCKQEVVDMSETHFFFIEEIEVFLADPCMEWM